MISRQPGVSVHAASGCSHSSHKHSAQASPALQRACPEFAAPAAPGGAPPAPALGGSAAPPTPEPPLDAAGCPLPGAAPPEPAFGAKGMGSPLPSEPPAPPLRLALGAAPLSGTPPTLSEPAISAPAVAAGPGTLAQPGSSQVNEASWMPSTELHADAASRTAMREPTLAVTPHHAALACRPCSRDLLFTRRRSGLWNFAFRGASFHRDGAACKGARRAFRARSPRQKSLVRWAERSPNGRAKPERQSEARTAERSPNGRAKPEPTCFGLSAAQLSFAVPSVWCTRRR
jgi:hypothetical protein